MAPQLTAVTPQWMGRQLALLAVLYNTRHSPEELALLADLWCEDLSGEAVQDIHAALQLHRKESTRFPTPADVLALLPRCRQQSVRHQTALPESTCDSDRQIWRTRARLIRDALRDGVALEQLAPNAEPLRAVVEHLHALRSAPHTHHGNSS